VRSTATNSALAKAGLTEKQSAVFLSRPEIG